jgi:hypothetical protein
MVGSEAKPNRHGATPIASLARKPEYLMDREETPLSKHLNQKTS